MPRTVFARSRRPHVMVHSCETDLLLLTFCVSCSTMHVVCTVSYWDVMRLLVSRLYALTYYYYLCLEPRTRAITMCPPSQSPRAHCVSFLAFSL